ncbi:MAG: DUF455 family protein, partial [Verrucomicrobiae bacterium]|nr:DUF455 family protein [Verrucomicrobiae bacterium]
MTFTEYAERILFSDDLEEKLRLEPLDTLIDEPETAFARAIPASKTPEPGRPVTLVPRKPREHDRAPLPSRPQLVEEESRGTLFHFFGNHEMLASELMALALLKFPDAPAEFRAGLLRTLREEQRHTRWYVERMRECGVPFGSQPVSRFFWDAVAPMETPLDYVTRLCLTFEQANLDYARHYGAILREAGDTKSARILERIYEDEIGHVGYGLTWFRRWKSRDETDWEAFRKHLAFPLSPSRAKGNGAAYNAEGRIAAGLDPDFVRELSVFERSKGRTPTVHWFNPDAEDVVAAPSLAAYHPRQTIERFIADLETLPAFLARRDDVVLVRAIPTRAHRERLRRLGIDLPEFEALDAETGG